MSGDEIDTPERRLADAMAAYDDRLAAGRETPTDELGESVDPDLLPEWERLAAFLTLVEQAWPRDAAHPDRRTEPAPYRADRASSRRGHGATRSRRRRPIRPFPDPADAGPRGVRDRVPRLGPGAAAAGRAQGPQPETLMTPEARKRFLREAHAAAGLDHPNIVPVYESGSVGTVAYIASAYCPARRSRTGWRRQCQPVPPRDAATLVADARPSRRACPRARRAPPRPETQQCPAPAPGGGRR